MTSYEAEQKSTVEDALNSIRKVMSEHLENSRLTSPYEMARIQSQSTNLNNDPVFSEFKSRIQDNVLELTQLLREDGTIDILKNQEGFMSEDVKQPDTQ